MSGLLHRLAAQALGQGGPTVHSLARIPYVAPLELAEEIAAPAVRSNQEGPPKGPTAGPTEPPHAAADSRPIKRSATLSSADRPTRPAARETTEPDALADPTPEPPVAEAVTLFPPGQAQQAARAVTDPELLVHRAPDSPGHTPANAGRSPERLFAEAPVSAPPARTAADTPSAPEAPTLVRPSPPTNAPEKKQVLLPSISYPAALMPPPAADAPFRASAGTEQPRPTEPPDQERVVAPAPLLGSLQVTPRPTSNVRSGLVKPMEIRSVDEPETTEVHVHIGRIEVTAVHEAPPSKPKRPPARSPMSLDEYLARRREERR